MEITSLTVYAIILKHFFDTTVYWPFKIVVIAPIALQRLQTVSQHPIKATIYYIGIRHANGNGKIYHYPSKPQQTF